MELVLAALTLLFTDSSYSFILMCWIGTSPPLTQNGLSGIENGWMDSFFVT